MEHWIEQLLSVRALGMAGSGIRRAFELGAKLKNPMNFSIGQPDFPVAEPMKQAAIDAIRADRNGYSLSRGVPELHDGLLAMLRDDIGWTFGPSAGDSAVFATSGTSGGLILACMALLNPGDEIIIPDPYFVLYPALASLCDAKAVPCDTYPDFRMTAARAEKLITPRTKALLINSPSNPAGTVNTEQECRELLDLCKARNIVLISDEIYDEFAFSEARTQRSVGGSDARLKCPSPARLKGAASHTLLIRGFGKTYGCTGWRLGYAAGPRPLIDQMTKLQQFSFVCPPTPLQYGAVAALHTDMSGIVSQYEERRDFIVQTLGSVTELATPGGAFYAFPKVSARYVNASAFMEAALEHNIILVNGGTFSTRDTHVRISYARPMDELRKGIPILAELLK